MVRSAMVGALAVSWVAAAGGLGGATAAAETVPPAQAVADNGVFLEHAPPPLQPAAVCIVDSGVDLNPDTASQVVFREALDGGDPGDVSPDKHGTLMAMMAAAPVNGWGMVGAAPGAVKIVSVRVEEPGEGAVPFHSYQEGIAACQGKAAIYNIRVISLSLAGADSPQGGDELRLEDAVGSARSYGLDVLAAAGNEGGPVNSPASYGGVVAIGAGDPGGALCAFSNRGPDLATVAPGCGLDEADPQTGAQINGSYAGTSEATAIAASALAALRAYRPDLSVNQAEQQLRESSKLRLDDRGLFDATGLDGIVGAGTPVRHPANKAATRLVPRPRVHVDRHGARVVVLALNRPRGAKMRVAVLASQAEFRWKPVAIKAVVRSVVVIRLGVTARRLQIAYLDASGGSKISSYTDISLGRLPRR